MQRQLHKGYVPCDSFARPLPPDALGLGPLIGLGLPDDAGRHRTSRLAASPLRWASLRSP